MKRTAPLDLSDAIKTQLGPLAAPSGCISQLLPRSQVAPNRMPTAASSIGGIGWKADRGRPQARAWVAAIAVSREPNDVCLNRCSRPGGASLGGVPGLFSEGKCLDVAIECP